MKINLQVMSTVRGGILVMAISLLGAPAQAGSLGGASGLWSAAASALQTVDYQRCWRHNGVRHCRWYGVSHRNDDWPPVDVGSRNPNEFRFGSNAWWRAMDRDRRGGFRS